MFQIPLDEQTFVDSFRNTANADGQPLPPRATEPQPSARMLAVVRWIQGQIRARRWTWPGPGGYFVENNAH